MSNPYSLGRFLHDKLYFFFAALAMTILASLFLTAFRVRLDIILFLAFLWLSFLVTILTVEYLRKQRFYRSLLHNIDQLDQAYLVLETLVRPTFYDGEVLYQALYRINKSMAENIRQYRTKTQDFQEYVEMWIHEVKTPLATLAIISRDPQVNEQIKRVNDYVEQILYFARAENAERDYLIKPTNLADVVGEVATRNREILQAQGIDFHVHDLDYTVRTDAKWLEFILNQILNNSIKYHSTEIIISAHAQGGQVTLSVHDNGIGIKSNDLPRVFEKSFTGSNGRRSHQSTGMGLYIVKTLCEKLGHEVTIDSVENQFTEVKITFNDSEYYKVIE